MAGLGFVAAALFVYLLTGAFRTFDPYYNHFVWQALAFLDGRAAIDYPVGPAGSSPGNAFFQDVLPLYGPDGQPTGRGLLPFPPLPAFVLLPFVAVWGLATNDQVIAAVVGAIDVGIAWWMLGRLDVRLSSRAIATAFFAFGTVFWYTAQLGTTWYFAHLVAVGLTLASVGVALGADREAVARSMPGWTRARWRPGAMMPDRRGLLAGLLLGLAGTARLSVLFGLPFFLLVGGGGWLRRAISVGVGIAVPVGALLVYNLASSGHLVHPAYEYLYRAEAHGYPTLNYHPDWAIEDPRYIPQNIGIALLGLPVLAPDAIPASLGGGAPLCVLPGDRRGLFDLGCPLLLPRDTGMSVLISSPAYLLALPALAGWRRRTRVVAGSALAVLLIAIFNLMHFSQGWVQVGYRFSNDFVPFALPLVALGIDGLRGRLGPVAVGALVVASIAVGLWSVVWGNLLGW